MEILRLYQANVMLLMSGICGIMALFALLTKTMSKKRKIILVMLELGAMLLMIADRRAYIYRGDVSTMGWWMVRISNFLVFFLTLFVLYCFNLYLINLYMHEGGLAAAPIRLKVAKILAIIGMVMVVISQFTSLYYTFDEMNQYQRSPGFVICYIIPITILVLQISVILQYRKSMSSLTWTSLILFTSLCIIASIAQVFMYGISLTNISIVILSALLYIFALLDLNREVDRARKREIDFYKEEQKKEHALFEQTAEALASAIDAKDKYTHGHSTRVAMYSTEIARAAGKTEEECEKIYFAALLHDVGKIGVSDAVINKDGKLTDEEFAQIKLHPVYGNQILSRIQQSPYLSIGAHYHHERYDGRGYPEGLKGEDIPDIARVISVADAYDAMTSKRSYRDPIPQQTVREELVKGIGHQFDPEYAKIMLHLIDLDIEYDMREREEGMDEASADQLHCESICHDCSVGIPVTEKMVQIRFRCRPDEGFSEAQGRPALILFDALDGRVHEEESKKKDLFYFEYGQIRADGRTVCTGARKIRSDVKPAGAGAISSSGKKYSNYAVEAVRVRDHVLIRFSDKDKTIEHIVALPDSSRFAYISLTGEHCTISSILECREAENIAADYIPRIAEEVSYIRNCPQGDVPNVQIDGWRTQSTKGVPITDGMKITFHTQSLPTARLVWHCPFVSIFTSENGCVDGPGYREFLLLRLDGETWESDEHAENEVQIDHAHSFPGWNTWKDVNKQGMDCEITIRLDGSCVIVETENLGISIVSRTTIKDDVSTLYAALTGDQCAITNIHFGQK